MKCPITIAVFDNGEYPFSLFLKRDQGVSQEYVHKMTSTLSSRIMEALAGVAYKEGDIVSSGVVSGLTVSPQGDVVFALEVDPSQGAALEPLRQAAEAAVRNLKGVSSVLAVLTAERAAQADPAPQPKPAAPDPHGMNKNPPLTLPVRHVIAVGSGKGGVGKSTVAFNLAVALSRLGVSVGLLDADIYGPSVPRLSGLGGQRPSTGADGKIIPLEAHGIKLMSIGFMVEEEKPMIWRGPMVQSAVYQMFRDVSWRNVDGDLDVLIVDMPPGTGDVQLTIAQKVPVTGAVIVSTPQDLALIDARKAIEMFEKTGVKILGIIENMSYYCCPSCGHEEAVFGHGGARLEAENRNVPFLGELPLNGEIRACADRGEPVDYSFYKTIAEAVLNSVKSAR